MVDFSVIMCGVDPVKREHATKCYENALGGESWELLYQDNAPSMCSGYMKGVEQSNGRYLIFSHDDAAPLRRIGARVRSHLRTVDVLGGCGTSRLIGPQWFTAGPPFVYGQVLNRVSDGFLLSVFGVPSPLVQRVQAIDGFWMAARREAVGPGQAWFDPKTFDHFHFYDLDFSFGAHRRGLNVGVATDLALMHASTGGYDAKWQAQIPRFNDKWARHLQSAITQRKYTMTSVHTPDIQEAISLMDEFCEITTAA